MPRNIREWYSTNRGQLVTDYDCAIKIDISGDDRKCWVDYLAEANRQYVERGAVEWRLYELIVGPIHHSICILPKDTTDW